MNACRFRVPAGEYRSAFFRADRARNALSMFPSEEEVCSGAGGLGMSSKDAVSVTGRFGIVNVRGEVVASVSVRVMLVCRPAQEFFPVRDGRGDGDLLAHGVLAG